MLIGVKYCGGCNPKYNRKEIIQKLMKHCNINVEFVNTNASITYDVVLVLSGCKSNCTDYKNIKSNKGYIIVTDEKGYNDAIVRIKEILKEKHSK